MLDAVSSCVPPLDKNGGFQKIVTHYLRTRVYDSSIEATFAVYVDGSTSLSVIRERDHAQKERMRSVVVDDETIILNTEPSESAGDAWYRYEFKASWTKLEDSFQNNQTRLQFSIQLVPSVRLLRLIPAKAFKKPCHVMILKLLQVCPEYEKWCREKKGTDNGGDNGNDNGNDNGGDNGGDTVGDAESFAFWTPACHTNAPHTLRDAIFFCLLASCAQRRKKEKNLFSDLPNDVLFHIFRKMCLFDWMIEGRP